MTEAYKLLKKMELLAPAGDLAALRAAVCAGADAVYLGMQSFGARASAGNFDEEELVRAVEYAHLHHVRVYVTLNTLIKEGETAAVYRALSTLAHARGDAVIVQDLGVASMVRESFPTLGLHASTQMALHNATGASWAKAQGFDRVVLARECSLEEIHKAANTGIEIEVFVHGALCTSVSGQCLMSSMAGGRSGNRGRCAQPCRQKVSLGEHSSALLSMKDLCLRDHLPELEAAGVTSLKIEGRLKRPEYVAIVTESYRRALDALKAGRFQPGDAAEMEGLRQIFHRGGFTLGHAMGAQDADLCATDHVGHGGVQVGRVAWIKGGLAGIVLEKALHDGDGLQIRGQEAYDFRYSGKEKGVGEEAVLRLRLDAAISMRDPVFRLTDTTQMARAEKIQQEKLIPITMQAKIEAGKPLALHLSDGAVQVTVQGELAQQAKTRPTTAEDAHKQLEKLGGTPFALASGQALTLVVQDGAFVPVSALNELRRSGVQELAGARCADFFGKDKEALLVNEAKPLPALKSQPKAPAPTFTDKLAIRFGDAGLATAFQALGAELLLFAPLDMREEALDTSLNALPKGAFVELPPQMAEADLQIALSVITKHAKTLGGVVLGSIGQLGAAFPVPIALGPGIPLMNKAALEAMRKENPVFWTIWPELSLTEMKDMQPFAIAPLLTVYGRERLMVLNHCPFRVAQGKAKGRLNCSQCREDLAACGQKDAALTDRKGFRFPLQRVRMSVGCLVNVLGALPTDLRRQEEARKALGAGMLLSFTVESAQEQLRIAGELAALCRGEAPSPQPLNQTTQTTHGHFFRGVE